MALSAPARPAPPISRLWNRELEHYPRTGPRMVSLAIVVLTTIVLYYQFYLAGSLAAGTAGRNGIIPDLHMSFVYYVNISVVGYLFGAAASFLAGLADRYGRANIVTIGLFVTGVLCLVGIPNAHSKMAFAIVFVAIGFAEGIILVATPALIRDFSPQLGRASAMGFWTLGPVLGSLVVSVIVSSSSESTPWRDQYAVCGVVGLVVFVIAAVGLRELKPSLRDQLMVSGHDRALIEARAKGIDVEAALDKPLRHMLKLDIVGSAFAISVFLIIYYIAVGFFPVFFQTVFGYSQSKANTLGNWFWACDALGLLIIGFASDKIRVRKPFMLVGAIGAIVFTSIFAMKATQSGTSYSTFVVILSLLSVSLGVAYAPWMASFTETVERRNPALTATGLAVWGLIIRIVIAVSVFFVPHVVNTVTTLVDKGGTAQQLAAKYAPQLVTAARIDPATTAALAKNPADQAAQVKALSEISGLSAAEVVTVATLSASSGPALAAGLALDSGTAGALLTNPGDRVTAAKAVGEIVSKLGISPAEAVTRLQALARIPITQLLVVQRDGPRVQDAAVRLTALSKLPAADAALLTEVQKSAKDSPKQWQKYFWFSVGGEVVFIPLIFVMAGFWDPRKAKKQEDEHEAWVDVELAKLT
jgi:ACS family D-galactonate transporter-like MFS transporter